MAGAARAAGFRLKGLHRALAGLMLRGIGLPGHALTGDFEELYVARLLRLIRESSLGAVVLLGHDQVYETNGRVMEGAGSFHVPSDFRSFTGTRARC